jgi:cyclopropane fatty-acyl-phospholipid synthase-like methyltransferase
MSLRSLIVTQFRQPRGPVGRLVGHVMATRPSNRERYDWTVGLLNLEPNHRVLEIGCGPGLGIERCAAILKHGFVLGIDHSDVMVEQARRRNAAAIAEGRADIRRGSLEDIDGPWDRICSINVIQFLPDIADAFRTIHDTLTEGGLAATAYQPRMKNPTRQSALDMAEKIEDAMVRAGFTKVERHERDLEPAPVICVTGVKADRKTP